MENFELTSTIFDAVIAGIVLISAILAYSRGLTREVFTLGVWVLAAFAALNFYKIVEPLILDFIDLGSYTPWAAIAIAFVLALVILSIISSVISKLIRNSALGSIDKGLGFLFGLARGLVLLAIVWILFEGANPATLEAEAIQTSRFGSILQDTATAIRSYMPTEMPDFLKTAMSDLFDKAPGAGDPPTLNTADPATTN